MSKKILTRLSLFLLVLFGITILTFIYTNLSPVDAAEALAVRRYSRPTPEQVELVREELGLDKPLIQQYGSWLWNALHGDFGNSYNTGRPIIEELTASLGPTITMASLALLFAAIFSIPLGVLSASKKGGLFDKTVYLFGIVSMSLPNYWIGFMLLLAFSVQIPIFSIMGADSMKDFILPALALAIPVAAGNIRVFRSSLLEGYSQDFVLYARSRGVSERRIAFMVSRFFGNNARPKFWVYDSRQRNGGISFFYSGNRFYVGNSVKCTGHYYNQRMCFVNSRHFCSG